MRLGTTGPARLHRVLAQILVADVLEPLLQRHQSVQALEWIPRVPDSERIVYEAAAQEAKRRAEDVMANRTSEFEYAKAQAELVEAAAQLRAIERIRKGKRT